MSYLRRRCCTCGGTTVLYTSTTAAGAVDSTIARRDPGDFTVIVSRTTAGLYDPAVESGIGVGGNADRCWYTSSDQIFRLNPDTLALVAAQAHGLGFRSEDIGGSSDRVWFAHRNGNVYEFDPGPPPSIVKSAAAPGDSFSEGIGGDDGVVWALGFVGSTQHIYELDPSDFSIVRDGGTVFNSFGQGCGGGTNVIWQTDTFIGDGRLHQRSPADFTIIKTQTGFTDELSSAGGK